MFEVGLILYAGESPGQEMARAWTMPLVMGL